MILAHADDAGMDVTVTSTHGRSGTSRYANGNVAGKVVGLADLPVPTVRAADARGGIRREIRALYSVRPVIAPSAAGSDSRRNPPGLDSTSRRALSEPSD